MKKLFTFAFLFLSCLSYSQVWRFTHSTGTYTPLPTTLPNLAPSGWDDDYLPITLPFNLTIRNITSNQWYIDTYGAIIEDTTTTTALLLGYFCDLQDFGNATGNPGISPIRMQTSGTSLNQIVKIEFVNAGFYTGDSTEFVNFQIWIYQNNTVEYRMGPSSFVFNTSAFGGSAGPIVGVVNDATNGIDEAYLLDSVSASPIMVYLQNASTPAELDDTPSSGKIYRFEKQIGASSHSAIDQKISIFPNPAHETIFVKNIHSGDEITLFNAAGQMVWHELAQQNLIQISSSDLPNGLYFLHSQNKLGRVVQKILIQH